MFPAHARSTFELEDQNPPWSMLRSAKDEFLKLTDQTHMEYNVDHGAFFYYLAQHYGLCIESIDGTITSEYSVINEKKYLIFLLKFGQ